LNPKKRKHQETPAEELWKGESPARGSWQEKDAGWEGRHPDWSQDEDAGQGAWQQGAWEQKQEDYRYDPQKEHDLQKELDHDEAVCLEEENKQKEDDVQKDNEEAPTNMEIQGGADQSGGLGNVWHADCQLQQDLPSTEPVPEPSAAGRHNPPARTGAARISRARVASAVAAGTTNPSKAGLKNAERQLRQCQGKGKSKKTCAEAKNKVRDYQQRVLEWDHHRQANIEGTPLSTFDRQRLGAAADEYATSKFSENIRNFDAAERAQRE